MHPEDRLDALLTALRQPERERQDAHPESGRTYSPAGWTRAMEQTDADLLPLLDVARQFDPLRTAQPDPRFAQALRARMLERVAERRVAGSAAVAPVAPVGPARLLAAHWRPLRTALVAASLLLALGLGTLTAAAAAGPGSILFGLHRLEQNVQAATVSDPAGRAHMHLGYARQWLAAVRAAADQHAGDPTYSDALGALGDEDAAAAQQIGLVPAGATRAGLDAELSQLRADERTTLRAALPALDWPDRLATTQALGTLGVSVPRATQATLVHGDDAWHIELTGSGFQPGATLLLNGQPAGQVTVASDGRATADLPASALRTPPASVGLGNPDGTAAATTSVRVLSSSDAGPSATETPGDHEGHGTPGPGDGDNHATATPGTSESGDKSTPGPTPTSGGHDDGGSPTPTP